MGKRIVNAYKNLDKNQAYSLKDAVKIVKENAKAKFDETIDIAINLGVDPKYADQMVRGVCALPHGTGKTVRVAVLAQGEKADQAKAAGADIVGAENLIALTHLSEEDRIPEPACFRPDPYRPQTIQAVHIH